MAHKLVKTGWQGSEREGSARVQSTLWGECGSPVAGSIPYWWLGLLAVRSPCEWWRRASQTAFLLCSQATRDTCPTFRILAPEETRRTSARWKTPGPENRGCSSLSSTLGWRPLSSPCEARGAELVIPWVLWEQPQGPAWSSVKWWWAENRKNGLWTSWTEWWEKQGTRACFMNALMA